MTTESSPNLMLTSVKRAYSAFLELGKHKGVERSRGVKAMAQGMQKSFNSILEANTLDLEMSREMAMPELILDWLKLTPERLQHTVEILELLAESSDPIQRVVNAAYQLNPSQTYCQ
ncbi:MAG: gamma-glutamyl-phosphate reductase, partial [Brasilonema sp.]